MSERSVLLASLLTVLFVVVGERAPASAQGAASQLGSPSEAPARERPPASATAPGPSEPDPSGDEDAEDAEAPADDSPIEDARVPAPPGAAPADEARYPVPTPREVARIRAGEEEPAIRIPSRVTTRLRALDANLRSLAAQGGGNVVNAVLSLITGGLSITLGIVKEPNDDWLSIYLYVYGGTAAARGALDLILAPNPSGQAITYQHMPMTSPEEVRARLEYGENALRGLADQALTARVLDASLNMAAGVAVVPIYLAPNDFEVSSPLDYFVLIGAGVSIISGIVTLLSTSAAEQRWSAYEELRERLARERADERRGDGGSAHEDEDPVGLDAPRAGLEWRLSAGGFALTF